MMKEEKTIIASTPEVLAAFLANRLEQEYYIYCRFKYALFPVEINDRKIKGIIYQDKVLRSETEIVTLNFNGSIEKVGIRTAS